MGTKAKNKEKSIIADSTLEFQQLMMQYDCAMLEVKTKLEVLNKELSLVHSRNPFESIKCRIKSQESIIGKLERRGLDFSIENMERSLRILRAYA